MKVLVPGDLNNTVWKKEITCTGAGNNQMGCGAKLEVTLSDIYITSSSSYDGSTDEYHTVQCIACGAETDLPKRIRFPQHGTFPSKKVWLERQAAEAKKATGE